MSDSKSKVVYYKVKIESGAFINDCLYRKDEVVSLPEGTEPNWGVKCTPEGVELESMSEKILNKAKMQEQLAKSVEGKDSTAATKALAKENAELKMSLNSLQDQVAKLTELMSAQLSTATTAPATPVEPTDPVIEVPSDIKHSIDEAVKLLEDGEDDQWTNRGEPRLDLLKEMTGLDVLTRADVDAVNARRRVK